MSEQPSSCPSTSESQSKASSTPCINLDPSTFSTYAQYLEYTDPTLERPEDYELFQYLKGPLHVATEDVKPGGWVLRIGAAGCYSKDCREFETFSDYRTFLSRHDDSFQYQIIIRKHRWCEVNSELRSFPCVRDPIHPEEVNTLGLELELPPMFWHTIIQNWRPYSNDLKSPCIWAEENGFIRIGRHFLAISTSLKHPDLKTGTYSSRW